MFGFSYVFIFLDSYQNIDIVLHLLSAHIENLVLWVVLCLVGGYELGSFCALVILSLGRFMRGLFRDRSF
jgi:hypothetical protein